jgi:hypothetical protein
MRSKKMEEINKQGEEEILWKDILKRFPSKNKYNTLPEGSVKIKFRGEPNKDFKNYDYKKGKNKGPRHHMVIQAILYLSENTKNKVTQKEHPLGLSRSSFQSLYIYLKNKDSKLKLTNRTFTCTNNKNRKYTWREINGTE